MVGLINNLYDEWRFNPDNEKGLGDLILSGLQKAGMLPPEWEGIPYECMGGMCQDPEHTWEPEDEA